MCLIERSTKQFVTHFGYEPRCSAYAPRRVTVIGAHTDYNGGRVISAAISRGTAVSIGDRGGKTVRIVSDREHGVWKAAA